MRPGTTLRSLHRRSALLPAHEECLVWRERLGLTREGLYKALSKDSNPSFGTVLKVMRALGLKFTPEVA